MTTFDKSALLLPNYRGRLLEGITYNPANNTLLWVDIILAEIHRISLYNENDYEKFHEVIKFDEPGESIGAIFLTEDTDIVVAAAKYGIVTSSFKTKKFSYLVKYPHTASQKERLRSNDGFVDPWGNIWIGVMNDFPTTKKEGVKAEGRLYRVDAKDLSIKVMIEDTFISNGLAFSQDRTKFYWADTPTYKFWVFDYDHDTVTLSNRQVAFDLTTAFPNEDPASPDGCTVTKDGVVYHAVFGKSTVLKYTLDGELLGKLKFPAERLTCTTFGGKNGDTLFVTSAHADHEDLDAPIKVEYEGDLGGYLFQVKMDPVNVDEKVHWKGTR